MDCNRHFKVGDTIRIKPDADLYHSYCNRYTWTADRDKYLGKIATITKVSPDCVALDITEDRMFWSYVDIELHEELLMAWIARDKDGSLFLHNKEPRRTNDWFVSGKYSCEMRIDKDKFPEVTWENSPKRISIDINFI